MATIPNADYIAKQLADEKAEVEYNLATYGTVYHPQDTAEHIHYLSGRYGSQKRKAFLKKLDEEAIPNKRHK